MLHRLPKPVRRVTSRAPPSAVQRLDPARQGSAQSDGANSVLAAARTLMGEQLLSARDSGADDLGAQNGDVVTLDRIGAGHGVDPTSGPDPTSWPYRLA